MPHAQDPLQGELDPRLKARREADHVADVEPQEDRDEDFADRARQHRIGDEAVEVARYHCNRDHQVQTWQGRSDFAADLVPFRKNWI